MSVIIVDKMLKAKKYQDLLEYSSKHIRKSGELYYRAALVISCVALNKPYIAKKQVKYIESSGSNEHIVLLSLILFYRSFKYIDNIRELFNRNTNLIYQDCKLLPLIINIFISSNDYFLLNKILLEVDRKVINYSQFFSALDVALLDPNKLTIKSIINKYNKPDIVKPLCTILNSIYLEILGDMHGESAYTSNSPEFYTCDSYKSPQCINLMGRSILLHMHIPRTGGTSAKQAFLSALGPDRMLSLSGRLHDYDFLGKVIDKFNDNICLISGHFNYGVHRFFYNGTVDYATVLRHPIEITLSSISHNISPMQFLDFQEMDSNEREFYENKIAHDFNDLFSRSNLLLRYVNAHPPGKSKDHSDKRDIIAAISKLKSFKILSFYPDVNDFITKCLSYFGLKHEVNYHLNTSQSFNIDEDKLSTLIFDNETDIYIYQSLIVTHLVDLIYQS